MALALAASYATTGAIKIEVLQTARFRDGSTVLMKDQPPVKMEPMDKLPTEHTLTIDTTKTYQEIIGFGGAFTEASAINWRQLSKENQEKVINLYFAGPEDGGHGYTLGRVPMDSVRVLCPRYCIVPFGAHGPCHHPRGVITLPPWPVAHAHVTDVCRDRRVTDTV